MQSPLLRPPVESEPSGDPREIAAILEQADAIVTAAGPEIVAEVEAARSKRPWWRPWRRRGDDGGFHLSNR